MAMNKARRRSWLTDRTTLLTNLDRLYSVLSVNKRKGRFCALHDLDFLAVRKVRAEGWFSQLPRKGFRVSKALRGLSHITAGRAALRKYQKVAEAKRSATATLDH